MAYITGQKNYLKQNRTHIIRHKQFKYTGLKVSWKKTCGKTTTEMGRQHQDRLRISAKCKRMKDTSTGGGYLEASF
jgi:ribosomal protein L32E